MIKMSSGKIWVHIRLWLVGQEAEEGGQENQPADRNIAGDR